MSNFYLIQAFDKKQFIREEVLTTSEAIEILEVSRARMSIMIKNGKIEPVKRSGATSLFLKEDILQKKAELIELRLKYGPK